MMRLHVCTSVDEVLEKLFFEPVNDQDFEDTCNVMYKDFSLYSEHFNEPNEWSIVIYKNNDPLFAFIGSLDMAKDYMKHWINGQTDKQESGEAQETNQTA